MIKSKEDYVFFNKEDKRMMEIEKKFPYPFTDEIWKFTKLMRKLEYYNNCGKKIHLPYKLYLKMKYRRLSVKLGFSIPINCFDSGVSIAHYGMIVINPKCKIGKNCRIHSGTNIGGTNEDVPIIGDNCYIGPGAKLFGPIKLGDGTKIGANAVVNKSFIDGNCTLVGVPAKAISK